MSQTTSQIRAKPIRESLDELARKVRRERESTVVKVYDYKEKDGYFSVSLTPVEKKRA
jgi:hypothetical protein